MQWLLQGISHNRCCRSRPNAWLTGTSTQWRVAALVYKRGLHAINAFTWPAIESGERAVRDLDRQGFHVRTWQHSGMNYWAISDLNDQDLDQFVRVFQEHVGESRP